MGEELPKTAAQDFPSQNLCLYSSQAFLFTSLWPSKSDILGSSSWHRTPRLGSHALGLGSSAPCRTSMIVLSFLQWVHMPQGREFSTLISPSYPSPLYFLHVSPIVETIFCESSGHSHWYLLCKSCNFDTPMGEVVSSQASVILLSWPHLSSFLFSNRGFPCLSKVECSCETFHKPKWLKVRGQLS